MRNEQHGASSEGRPALFTQSFIVYILWSFNATTNYRQLQFLILSAVRKRVTELSLYILDFSFIIIINIIIIIETSAA